MPPSFPLELGGHSRARSLVHESKAPAPIHQKKPPHKIWGARLFEQIERRANDIETGLQHFVIISRPSVYSQKAKTEMDTEY